MIEHEISISQSINFKYKINDFLQYHVAYYFKLKQFSL